LESGTVEINLAILGIDFVRIMSIFKSPRVHRRECFNLSDHWGVNLFLITSRIEYPLVASAAFLTRLAIFTRVKPNDVYFTGFVIVKLIAQDLFHWFSAPFPRTF
jgi:hypothetical protein